MSSTTGENIAQISSPSFIPYGPINVTTPSSLYYTPGRRITNPDPEGDSYYISSMNLSYSKPTYGVYENLNADKHVRKRIINYVKYKTLDKWLYGELKHLLKYVKLSKKKNSQNDTDKKVDYLEDNIVTDNFVRKIIEKYVRETQTNWYDIPKNDYFLKEIMEKELKKKLKK